MPWPESWGGQGYSDQQYGNLVHSVARRQADRARYSRGYYGYGASAKAFGPFSNVWSEAGRGARAGYRDYSGNNISVDTDAILRYLARSSMKSRSRYDPPPPYVNPPPYPG